MIVLCNSSVVTTMVCVHQESPIYSKITLLLGGIACCYCNRNKCGMTHTKSPHDIRLLVVATTAREAYPGTVIHIPLCTFPDISLPMEIRQTPSSIPLPFATFLPPSRYGKLRRYEALYTPNNQIIWCARIVTTSSYRSWS